MTPRRSILYVPGSNARALEKAKTLVADALIYDLEDAVAPDMKDAARENVVRAVTAGGFGFREIVVRINAAATALGAQDLESALAAKPDAILLPKVESAEDLHHARKVAARLEAADGVSLWAMIETPLALFNLKDIASAAAASTLPLTCFVLGTNDLVKATRAQPGPDRAELLPALALTVAAARAFGLSVVDGVYNAFQDEAGLRAECEQGRRLGMDGKTLVHPAQIAVCNAVFSPTTQEIETARRIVAAFGLAENAGKGAIDLDGRMVELLHKESAEQTLAVADAIAARLK